MAIKKVKAKSGQMYDVNSSQGRTIVAAATTGKDADFDSSSSSLGANAGMAETLQLIYGETVESGESLDNIEESLIDDGKETAEERAARLAKSNKDKKGNKFGKALGFAKDKIGAGTAKLKGSLSGKFGLALLGGGLLLLNKYGDEIAGPDGWLTKFLKYMKESFIPDIKALYESVTGEGGIASNLKKDFDEAWASISGFFTFFSQIGKTIKTYFKSFDTNDDGTLSGDEAKVMFETIWTDIKAALWKLTKDSAVALVSAIGLISIGKAALVTLFTAGTGLAPVAGGIAGLGVLGTAALVGVVAAGLWLLTEKVSDAYKDAITDASGNRENFKVKEFLARFFGGNDDEGGFFNSLTTGLKSAVIGGAAGAAYGSIVPGVGTAVGAAVGALVFGVIGVTGGALGKKKIKTWLDGFEIAFNSAMDSATSAFDRVVVAAKAVITPGVSVADALNNYDATKFSGGQQGDNNAQTMLSARIRKSRVRIQELKDKFYFNNGSVQAGIDNREIEKLRASIRNDIADKKLIPGYTPTEADIAAAEDAKSFSNTMDSVKSAIKSVSSLGFRATNAVMKSFQSDSSFLADIDARDLHNFAFSGSIFEKDFKSEDALELLAAQKAGYALDGEVPGSDKGNLGDYRKMMKEQNKFKIHKNKSVIAQLEFERKMGETRSSGAFRKTPANSPMVITNNAHTTSNSSQIVPTGLSARNDFWVNYDAVAAATK